MKEAQTFCSWLLLVQTLPWSLWPSFPNFLPFFVASIDSAKVSFLILSSPLDREHVSGLDIGPNMVSRANPGYTLLCCWFYLWSSWLLLRGFLDLAILTMEGNVVQTNPNNSDQSLNPASPFYLYPGENPGLTLISQILNETNYSSWSRNMKRALLSKNKLKFIDGGIKKPQKNDSLYDAWERCNMMVLSWIIKTLSP